MAFLINRERRRGKKRKLPTTGIGTTGHSVTSAKYLFNQAVLSCRVTWRVEHSLPELPTTFFLI